MMKDSLRAAYADVVQAALTVFRMNTVKQEGFTPVDQHIPVIPGVFPGECVTLTYAKDTKTMARIVTVSVPAGHGTDMKVGPFPISVPYGRTPEVPQAVTSLLDHFEKGGPERLSHRFRELVKELQRAGVGIDERREEVDMALAESIMDA